MLKWGYDVISPVLSQVKSTCVALCSAFWCKKVGFHELVRKYRGKPLQKTMRKTRPPLPWHPLCVWSAETVVTSSTQTLARFVITQSGKMSSNDDSGSHSESDSEILSLGEPHVFENNVEPLATAEGAVAYQDESQREDQEREELLRRFNRDVLVSSWYDFLLEYLPVNNHCLSSFCFRFLSRVNSGAIARDARLSL